MERLKKWRKTRWRLIDILKAKIKKLELHSSRLSLSKHHLPCFKWSPGTKHEYKANYVGEHSTIPRRISNVSFYQLDKVSDREKRATINLATFYHIQASKSQEYKKWWPQWPCGRERHTISSEKNGRVVKVAGTRIKEIHKKHKRI